MTNETTFRTDLNDQMSEPTEKRRRINEIANDLKRSINWDDGSSDGTSR
jgi:hypothetical protein